jgi:ABC-type nitrate/sulfonate/bicarbonate transport system substrate-binding protein
MASIAARESMVAEEPERAAAVVRSIVNTQKALREDPTLATRVGRVHFPPAEAELIAELIRRDLPYYDARITPEFIQGMNRFTTDLGLLERDVPYESIVAAGMQRYWTW